MSITSPPRGSVTVTPNRARRLAAALIVGVHPWAWPGGGPLSQLEGVDDTPLNELCPAEWGNAGRWTPDTTVDGAVVHWRPLNAVARPGRWISVDTRTGRITWDAGTGRPSRFIGSALCSACGGLEAASRAGVALELDGRRRRGR